MSRLIDADALTEFFKARMALWASVDEVLDVISDAPTIEVESEGVSPKMEAIEWDTQFAIASCGHCGKRLLGRSEDITNYFRYCPTCGKKVKWNETN